MYYLKIATKFNLIELIVDDFYDERVQQLIQQEYVKGVYLRWVTENELENDYKYKKVKRLITKQEDEKVKVLRKD